MGKPGNKAAYEREGGGGEGGSLVTRQHMRVVKGRGRGRGEPRDKEYPPLIFCCRGKRGNPVSWLCDSVKYSRKPCHSRGPQCSKIP